MFDGVELGRQEALEALWRSLLDNVPTPCTSADNQFFIWGVATVQVCAILALIIITPTRIMIWFNNFGLRIRGMGVKGWFLCILLVGMLSTLTNPNPALTLSVLASHPPLFGFAGSMSLIGFTYGIWPGFLIASFASMLGAAIAFLSVRVSFPITSYFFCG